MILPMRKPRLAVLCILAFLTSIAVQSADTMAAEPRIAPTMLASAALNPAEHPDHPAASAKPEKHTLPQNAVEITRIVGFPISNSMIVTWIVALGLSSFSPGLLRGTYDATTREL